MLTLHLEAETLTELRDRACKVLALDLASAASETKSQDISFDTAESAASPEKTETTQPDNTAGPMPQSEPAKKKATPRKSKGKDEQGLTDIADAITGKQETAPLTLESVRGAFDQYVQRFGVQAAQIDGPILLGRVFGGTIQRIKDIPEDDPSKLARIIAAVEGAILTNEFKRPAVQ
jgi:hypothetical protein